MGANREVCQGSGPWDLAWGSWRQPVGAFDKRGGV